MQRTAPTDEQIAALRTSLGLASQDSSVTRIPSSNNFVYRVGNYIIKVSGLDDDRRFEREFRTMERLSEAAPVARIVCGDVSRSRVPFPFFVMSFEKGAPLASIWHELSEAERSDLAQRIAGGLDKIHRLPTEGIPHFDSNRIPNYFAAQVAKHSLTDYEEREFSSLLVSAPEIAHKDSLVVTHGDLHLGNVLYDRDSGAMVIFDFDTVFCAVGAKDLVAISHSILTALLKHGPEATASYAPLMRALMRVSSIAKTRDIPRLLKYFFIERICWLRERTAEGTLRYKDLADGLSRLVFQENRLEELLTL